MSEARKAPRRTRAKAARLYPRLRLLPALIFIAVLMLGVRTGDLWFGLSAPAIDLGRPTMAEDPPGPPPVAEVAEAPGGEHAAAEGDSPAREVAEAPVETPAFDPDRVSEAELALLQELSARREALDAREQELGQREALLAAAERRVDEKVAELESLRDEIAASLQAVDDRQEEQIRGLVGIYEAMRPSDAAVIFNGLEMDVLLAVLERMRQQKSAPILAGMNPERAREVTSLLATRRAVENTP
jgi:flagellar motility protein MotE (MotC chaperone)